VGGFSEDGLSGFGWGHSSFHEVAHFCDERNVFLAVEAIGGFCA
jgi:hypothetical protein